MRHWNRIGWVCGVVGICLGTMVTLLRTPNSNALDETKVSPAKPLGKLVVHEWGTFTSFSGSNGVQLDFRPLINEDLPNFVLDRRMQTGVSLLSKGRIRAQIRMETPVTYFYTDEERTVRASVEFSNGLLTEFYPPVIAMSPPYDPKKEGQRPFGKSKLDWGEIDLIPPAKLAPAVKDPLTRQWLQGMIEQRVLPTEGASNHYYHARATDSAFVHIRRSNDEATQPFIVRPAGDYLEKFLFYRGVGRFEQPLRAAVADDGRIQVTNPGQAPLRSLFQVTVKNKSLTYSQMPRLAAGATGEFPGVGEKISLQDLKALVVESLVGENLYQREALAMVETWSDSWFAEEGTRIFYMVPREATDALLPLTITPAPDESVRVLVGRIEMMSPSTEAQLMELVRVHAVKRVLHYKLHKGKEPMPPLPIPEELSKLGRLAEPALVRIRELARDEAVSNEAIVLLNECRIALDEVASNAQSLSAASN